MLAATAMGLRLCGIFAQKQKPPADPHSFHTIPYSMKGLATATLSRRTRPSPARLTMRGPNRHGRATRSNRAGTPPLTLIANPAKGIETPLRKADDIGMRC